MERTYGTGIEKMKCNTCHKEYNAACDWNQGRCPLHPPMMNTHSMRFLNLFRLLKGLFK